MKVVIGSTTLGLGTRAQPARLVGSVGGGTIEVSPLIDSSAPDIFDRKNRTVRDVVEVDYSYASAALAETAVATLRKAALAASGNLVYGEGASAVTVGPAKVETVELLQLVGSGLTMRYTIIATETYS